MKDLLEIARKRLNPGILILDLNNRLTYANKEAFDILPAMKDITMEDGSKQQLPVEIFSLCDGLKTNHTNNKKEEISCSIIENYSGISYSLRAFFLNESADNTPTHIMVLIERIVEKHGLDFERAQSAYNLSKREVDVLKLLSNGEGNKRIAEKLFISEFTVKDHIKKIMDKMGVNSRNEVIALLAYLSSSFTFRRLASKGIQHDTHDAETEMIKPP